MLLIIISKIRLVKLVKYAFFYQISKNHWILPLLDLEEIFLFIFHWKVTDNIYNIYSGQLSVLPITILKKSSQEIVKFASLFLYGYTKTHSNELKF